MIRVLRGAAIPATGGSEGVAGHMWRAGSPPSASSPVQSVTSGFDPLETAGRQVVAACNVFSQGQPIADYIMTCSTDSSSAVSDLTGRPAHALFLSACPNFTSETSPPRLAC